MHNDHPIKPQHTPNTEVEALIDAGAMINYARMGCCDCTYCQEFKRKETTFANVAHEFFKRRHSESGKVFRALFEDWSISRVVEEFQMEDVA